MRAQDEKHSAQPDENVWNLKGFMGNGVYTAKKRIVETDGKVEMVFLHPTDTADPGNGWMEPSAEEKVEEARSRAGMEELKEVGWDEVKRHVRKEDLWIVISWVVCVWVFGCLMVKELWFNLFLLSCWSRVFPCELQTT